jgi:hypothetical protein
MMKTFGVIVAGALLAAPLTLGAQGAEGRADPRPGMGMHGPAGHGARGMGGHVGQGISVALEHRAQLNLTPEQVSRLETIQRELRARNEPLHQQLTAIMPQHGMRGAGPARQGERPGMMGRMRGMHGGADSAAPARPRLSDEQRQEMRARMEQARPVMEQIRAHTRAAMEQAHGVLSDAQRQQLHELMRERGGRGGAGHMRGERARRTR